MEHLVIRLACPGEIEEMKAQAKHATDGELFDLDVLEHDSTFVLSAVRTGGGCGGFLPVQQPLMLESFVAPNLEGRPKAQVLARMVEYAIGEAYRRDVGEIYFLTRDPETAKFALRHKFKALPDGLECYRLNLRETFGV